MEPKLRAAAFSGYDVPAVPLRRQAAAVTKAAPVAAAAVRGAVVGVLSSDGAALHRAQGPAVSITEAALVAVAAVHRAVVGVPPGDGAALHRTQGPKSEAKRS